MDVVHVVGCEMNEIYMLWKCMWVAVYGKVEPCMCVLCVAWKIELVLCCVLIVVVKCRNYENS